MTVLQLRPIRPPGWNKRAACRDLDSDLFFPEGTGEPARWQVAEAKQVCARCPVRTLCLDWAVRTGEQYGVWGGTTPDERRVLRYPLLDTTPA